MLRETEPGLVPFYCIWPGNRAGVFLQPRSILGAILEINGKGKSRVNRLTQVHKCLCGCSLHCKQLNCILSTITQNIFVPGKYIQQCNHVKSVDKLCKISLQQSKHNKSMASKLLNIEPG